MWIRAVVMAALLLAFAAGCGDDSGPGAPEGTRWVGSGRVVVAVPDWWSTGETRCLLPVEDTVYWESGAITDCADTPGAAEVGEVSALAVLDPGGAYAELLLTRMEPAGEVDGRAVLELPGCDGWIPRVCRRVFAVPSEGAVFAVTIADEADGDYQEIRDSLRVLDDGMTTVPLSASGTTPAWGAEPGAVDDLTRSLERVGLQVETEVLRPDPDGDVADLPEGSRLGIEPALGSVVDQGATMTITVMGAAGTS